MLLTLGIIPASAASPADWTGPDGNYPLNWNYSPLTSINQANVKSLQVGWIFPIPDAPTPETSAVGVNIPPLVVNGILYGVTNWGAIFALDASNGDGIWFTDLPLQQNYSALLQPSIPPSLGVPNGHFHQLLYTKGLLGRSLVWVIANTYQVFALDAFTGDVVVDFNPLTQSNGTVQGNFGIYDQDTPTIMLDQKTGIMVFGPSDSEGESSGRGFLEGWYVNSTTPKLLWTSYIIPPQDGSDPRWSLDSVGNMSGAYMFNGTGELNLKTLPEAALKTLLLGDWGNFGFDGTRSYAGASTAWGGSWALNEESGIAYVGTDTATPDWNATDRPGPDLWSDSVLAVNITTGALIWGFQAEPHPLGDLDCSWNVVLANETISGKAQPVVYKGCKDGYLFALNASTGSLIWYLKPQAIRYVNVFVSNPLNETEMTKVNWFGYPRTARVIQNPSDTGSLESDIAFDPTANSVFLVTYNEPKSFQLTDVGPQAGVPFVYSNWEFNWGADVLTLKQAGPINSTVTSVDASTGQVNWSYPVADVPYRGGVSVSDGVVYAPLLNGTLLALDEQSGRLLFSKNVGGELLTQPVIAQDVSGEEMLFLVDSGSTRWGPAFAGFLEELAVGQTQGPATSGTLLYAAIITGGAASIIVACVVYRLKTRQIK